MTVVNASDVTRNLPCRYKLLLLEKNGSVSEHLLFEGREYQVGRSESADIVISHPQVSRSHIVLRAADNDRVWQLNDMSSTGCFSAGVQIKHLTLDKPHVLQLGPVPCEFTPVELNNVVKLDSQREWRKQQLKQYQTQLQRCNSSTALINLARECLIQSLGCERASLILFDKINNYQLGVGYESWMQGDDFTGSRTIINQCMQANAVRAIGNIVCDDSLNKQHSIINHGIQAAICVPVCIEEKPVGVLYADSTLGRRYFTQTDIEFATSLANMISMRLLFHTIEHKLSLIS
ncbi:FHA domain-containing protein [Alteromonas macleodii str. 'Black Sea 11']|nr:FHA domain-containing protein [Alteromonas macleodii str. 'Black Sea 11']